VARSKSTLSHPFGPSTRTDRRFTKNKYRYGYDAAVVTLLIKWMRDTGAIDEPLCAEMEASDGSGDYAPHLLQCIT